MSDPLPTQPTPEAATTASPPDLVGQTLASGLQVVDRRGDSPEGALYGARSSTGQEVTLLVPGPQLQEGPALVGRVRQRTREERVRKVMELHHPNIAEILEGDVAPDGSPCYVLEPLGGDFLSSIVASRGVLPMAEAIDLTLQATSGLIAAHELGVVHGNLSPDAMLVTRTADGHPRLKLLGFTLGLFVGGARPDQRATAKYASLEQRCGVAADEQGDVYSLASVLHHLVFGAPPEAGPVAESIPRRLRAVLTKGLADARKDRFSSMAAFAGALERFREAADKPEEEGKSSRGRLLGIAASVVLVAGAWMFWGSRRDEMRVEAEPRQRTVPKVAPAQPAKVSARVPVDFDSVEGGVSHAATREPIAAAPLPAPIVSAAVPTMVPAAPGPSKAAKAEAPKVVKAEAPRVEAAAEPPGTLVSPFRRSHPWTAYPDGRFYYRSGCRETLEFEDLVYFSTEGEARAAGFLPAPGYECP
jgi:hypothetical protein